MRGMEWILQKGKEMRQVWVPQGLGKQPQQQLEEGKRMESQEARPRIAWH